MVSATSLVAATPLPTRPAPGWVARVHSERPRYLTAEGMAFVAAGMAVLPAARRRRIDGGGLKGGGRGGGRGAPGVTRREQRPERAPPSLRPVIGGRAAPTVTAAAPSPSLPGHTTVLLIPTGVGAAIGGYAGDGLPAARLLAAATDTLITHPNVLNGGSLYGPPANALYVEGYALDAFCAGAWGLRPVRRGGDGQAVGLLLDAGLGTDAVTRHVQVADAARATLGLRVVAVASTAEPLGVSLTRVAGDAAASSGRIDAPGALLAAADRLVEAGATALAVVALFPDEGNDTGGDAEGGEDAAAAAAAALAEYRAGAGVDALAGAEAVISHLLTRHTCLPCAHAPALSPLDADAGVSPKAAAEELGYTFLPCVLVGLAGAPSLLVPPHSPPPAAGDIWAADVDVVVVPADACGGAGLLALAGRPDPPLIVAVAANTTVLDVPPEAVGIEGVVHVATYAEAAGVVLAHRAGIFRDALGPDVPRIPWV